MLRLAFSVLAFTAGFAATVPAVAANRDRHVVVISIDGFPADLWRDPSLPLPVLRKLAADGVAADAMTTSNPSVTWPAHTTIISGVTPQKHGVLFNGLLVRQGPGKPPKIEQWVDKTALVFAPTLYDRAHAAGLTIAESDWVAVTRAKTINWSFAELPDPQSVVVRDMIAAKLVTPEDIQLMQLGPNRRRVTWRDHLWTQAACFMFTQYKPNLLLYHTLNTDSTHHRYGPGTDPSHSALGLADRLVGDLVAAVDRSGLRERTTFIITTDHGFKKVTQFAYPNVLLKQAGLLRTAGATVTHCDAYTVSNGGIAFVYITDPARKAELLPRLKALFTGAAGIDRVIDGQDAPTLGMPTPEQNPGMGELILYPKAGHAFSALASGDEPTAPAVNYGGSHGYFNGDRELDGIFIASGAGIRRGVRLERVRNLDIAPTIARLLDLELPDVDGTVMTDVLAPR